MIQVEDLLLKLVNYKSITPSSGEIFDFIIKILNEYEFNCNYFEKNGVGNLIAKLKSNQPQKQLKSFAFAGHLDVVPAGDEKLWNYDPFFATKNNGKIYGRGTSDMKGSIASFIVALIDFIEQNKPYGDIYLLLTGDEEGECLYGTKSIVEKFKENKNEIDLCLIGEPTSNDLFGDIIKNGRRGSINFTINVTGKQCHIAYPERGINPNKIIGKIIEDLYNLKFEKDKIQNTTNLEIFSINTSSSISNIIPNSTTLSFNVRFSHNYSAIEIIELVTDLIQKYNQTLDFKISGESFISPTNEMADIIKKSILETNTNQLPKFEISGGTSDARFLKDICKSFAEFGPRNNSIHQINEYIEIDELHKLQTTYLAILKNIWR
jgi:succinyl-diaminopimelate desuccinylase